MGRLDELISEQCSRWEKRGRGWKVWPHSVMPEPPFQPFTGFQLPRPNVEADDGRKPGRFASFFDGLERKLNPKPPVIPEPEEIEPEAERFERSEVVELQTLLPADFDIKSEVFSDFLLQLAVCREPVAFELLATSERITPQFGCQPDDALVLKHHLAGYFPEAAVLAVEHALVNAWFQSQDETLIVEFGLEQEFFLPLATGRKLDPFVGLLNAMSHLQPGELALFQVLFQAAEHDWKENALRLITDATGKAFFVNRVEWVNQAECKFASPVHAAVVRIASKAETFGRALDIARGLAYSLRTFSDLNGNSLIPPHNEDYDYETHEADVLFRQSHRSGMLLSSEELNGFVHFPSSSVRSPQLARQSDRTKSAPASVTNRSNFILGSNTHLGKTVPVSLSPDQRTRHTHVIGVPGTGKSNFIFNLILQSIRNGEGLAVVDPHGDLVDKVLNHMPQERISDVILLDPSDEEYSVPFNILSARSDAERRLIASDLTAVFQRLSTSWGDQMTSVLNNAILAFLESTQGGTLIDLRRFLIEPAFRNQFLKTVNDPNVVYYWQKGFPLLTGSKSIGPLLTRLDMLLAPKSISCMVSQKENRLDFSAMMNSGKIFLAKLSQGTMGQENSSLMGSLLMSRFHLAAMSRQALPESGRRNFYIYLDEAHNFATPSMVEILTGARKYHVGMILAHQELGQLERVKEIAGAILAANTRVVFRVTDNDARKLSEGFSFFKSEDLQNLETGHAICRVERADHDFNLSVPFDEAIAEPQAMATRQAVIDASRARYATPRAEVEAALREALRGEPAAPQGALTPMPKDSEQKAAEVQKPTSSEREKSVVIPAIPAPATQIDSPTDEVKVPHPPLEERGIGGHQHNWIRERIEAVARDLGYRPEREWKIDTGQKIDLALLRNKKISIAVEIGVTTTVDHEIGNVLKCIKAQCGHVAVICTTDTRLSKIQKAVTGCISAKEAALVGYYLPEQFIVWLKSLKPAETNAEATQPATFGKYKITRRASGLLPKKERNAKQSRIKCWPKPCG